MINAFLICKIFTIFYKYVTAGDKLTYYSVLMIFKSSLLIITLYPGTLIWIQYCPYTLNIDTVLLIHSQNNFF